MSLLAVDWGSTMLRCFLLDDKAAVQARSSSELGLQKAGEYGFDRALRDTAGELLEQCDRVLMCGMVGAREGWREAGYCDCPCDVAMLAASLVEVPLAGRRAWIVPGVSRAAGGGLPDVMRGEETQIVGALAAGHDEQVYVLPGTHCKWVQVQEGAIVDFTTYLTGDVYMALKGHTVLGLLMRQAQEDDAEAFRQGVERGADTASGGELLSLLFSSRTLGLVGRLEPGALASYLQGVLIGAEIAAGRRRYGGGKVALVGSSALMARYAQACAHLQVPAAQLAEELAAGGLAAISGCLPQA